LKPIASFQHIVLNVKNPVLPYGVLPKKKPFSPFIPALPIGAFWLFHGNRTAEEQAGAGDSQSEEVLLQ